MTPDNATALCFIGLAGLALLDVFLTRRFRKEMEALQYRIAVAHALVERDISVYRGALRDIINLDHHNMGPESRATKLARAALNAVEAAP